MIFVTVGTHSQGFDRLIRKMDEIAAASGEPVVMQTGTAAYEPEHAEYFKFGSSQRVEELVKEARLVVSHAGAASIINALRYGKPIIIVPRQKKYGEHFDDHQMELAAAMAADNRIRAVFQIEDLEEAIKKSADMAHGEGAVSSRGRLVSALRRHLEEIQSSKK